MKLIIPTAGLGTRLRPHTHTRPKPLVNVAGKPVLAHILDAFLAQDLPLEEMIFVVGYLGEKIEAFVRQNYDLPARFVEQKELLGQAHAILLTEEVVKEGPVLIAFVDTLFEADLRELPRLDADGVIYVKEVEDPRRFGVVLTEGDRVVRLIEKPDEPISRQVNIGLYYLRDSRWLFRAIREIIDEGIQTKGEYYLADALQRMVDQGAHLVVREVQVWEDCGKPETVLQTNRYLLEHGHATNGQGEIVDSVIISPVYIAPTARVERSVVGPYVTLADGCVVRDSVIRDSIVGERAQIETSLLAESLIGEEARVRTGFRKLNVGDSSQVDFSTPERQG